MTRLITLALSAAATLALVATGSLAAQRATTRIPHDAELAPLQADVRPDVLKILITLEAEERRLLGEFDLRRRALAATGRAKERAALTGFLTNSLLPFLTSGMPLYNSVDSLTGGGYATSVALIEQYYIDDHVSYLAALRGDQDAAFGVGIAQLAALLDNYFRKQRLLVRPILLHHLTPVGPRLVS